MKLFCIPYSGGNAYSYSGFRKYLPDSIELCTLELPGRGKRIAEPLLYSIEDMTEDLFLQIENRIDEPYAIFGHSLGALLGYTLCRAISIKGMVLPEILFLSGQTAARFITPDNKCSLPDDEFINLLREMEGTPEELLTDNDFLQYFLPVIKADFQSVANYRHVPSTPPLKVPIAVLLGNLESISMEDASSWQEETNRPISIHKFEGRHFFIFNKMEEVCRLIAGKCNPASTHQHISTSVRQHK